MDVKKTLTSPNVKMEARPNVKMEARPNIKMEARTSDFALLLAELGGSKCLAQSTNSLPFLWRFLS